VQSCAAALLGLLALANAASSENTPPTLVINQVLVMEEGGFGVITNDLLLATDPESPPDSIFFEVAPDSASFPTEHGLFRNGTEILTYGSFFTQADIDSGQITYQHDGSEFMTDGFAFRVTDADGAVASDQGHTIFYFGMFFIPVNDAPAARDTTYTTGKGTAFTDILPGSDPDSPNLTYSITSNGTIGTATIVDPDSGVFSYSPMPLVEGTDTFTYEVFDGFLSSNPGTVTVNVGFVPTARDTSYITGKGQSFTDILPASDPDSSALTYSIVSNGTLGTAVIVDADSGLFSYSPFPLLEGTDTFTYEVFDGFWISDPGTVTVDITNRPPVAVPDTVLTNEGILYSGVLSAVDPDNDPLVFRIDSDGALGTVVVTDSTTGDYTYTPDPGRFGWDLFTFIASDGELDSDPDTVRVSIRPSVDPGHIVIADDSHDVDQLFLFDPVSHQVGSLSWGGLLESARAVALEVDGSILVLDQYNGVFRVDPVDGSQTIVSPGSNFSTDPDLGPVGLAIEATGSALVADPAIGVVRVDVATGDTTVVTPLGDLVFPTGLAIAENGDVFVTDAGAFVADTSRIVRIDPVSGNPTVISVADNLVVPLTIALEADGHLVVSDIATKAGGAADFVLRIDPVTGTQTMLSSGGLLATPRLGITNSGRIFVISQMGSNLLDVDPVTGAQTLIYSGEPFQGPAGLAIVPGIPTDVEAGVKPPTRFRLFPSFPNPFSSTTTLRFQVPERVHVSIAVYNVLGELVADLVDEDREPGRYSVTWTPGNPTSGVYFFRLKAGDFAETRKLVLLR